MTAATTAAAAIRETFELMTITVTPCGACWRVEVASQLTAIVTWRPTRRYPTSGAALAAGRAWVRAGWLRLAQELAR